MKQALILLFLLSFSQISAAAPSCRQLFSLLLHLEPEKVSIEQSDKMMSTTTVNPNSTTSKRAEDKATLLKSAFEPVFTNLKENLEKGMPGFQLKLRDQVREGFHNVTWTRYSNKFNLKLSSGLETTGVFRLRKYGWVSLLKEVVRENIEINPAFKEISSLEFKVRDPEFQHDQFNSVLKPINKIYDVDADILFKGGFTREQFDAILERTLKLNSDPDPAVQKLNHETVVRMFEAIVGLHKEGNRLELAFETLYKRSSYKIDVTEPGSSVKRDAQITVDEHISTLVIEGQMYSKTYQTEQPIVVVETKLPISFIPDVMNPAGSKIRNIASALAKFVNAVREQSLSDFEIGKGKLGHTIREFIGN